MFETTPTSLLDRIFYGNITQRRIEYVKARLIDVDLNREPDEDKYLDGYGHYRRWDNRPPPKTDGAFAAVPGTSSATGEA